MEKSLSLINLAKGLLLFQTKVSKISKDGTNPFFKSKYATLSNILEEIQVPLAESGLTFSQFPTGDNGLTSILIHAESGEYLQDTCIMHPAKSDPQSLGSAITYNRRYSLQSILGLNIEDDDDGHRATHNGNSTATNGELQPEITWLSKEQFEKAMKADVKGITATITKFSKAPFAMSKEYREKLNNQLSQLTKTK